LEVCVDSIESALAAVEGGCFRIELCSALSEGGLTPSPGVLKSLIDHNIKIPIFCMLRPRGGSDFIYSEDEINAILYDIKILKSLGADGFVFGALNENRDVNIEQCQKIIKECGSDVPVTFHRAFDFTNPKDLIKNLDLLENLGFKRVLTSGFKETAELGIEYLKMMSKWSIDKNLIVLPGAGINEKNLEKILNETFLKEFHSSAKKKIEMSGDISLNGESNNSVIQERRYVTDSKIVAQLINISKNIK